MDAPNSNEQWRLLVPVALARVFTFLDPQDRIHAGSTCRHWRQVFYLPEFFREKSIVLFARDKKELAANKVQAVRYLENFGHHLRHFNLQGFCDSELKTATAMSKAVEELLTSAPAGMKLQTFSCEALLTNFRKSGDRVALRARTLNALSKLLTSQSQYLEKVILGLSFLSLEEGCRIMEALATHNVKPGPASATTHLAAPLNTLELFYFFNKVNVHVGMCPKFSDAMGGFGSLCKLKLHFVSISDYFLEKLSTGSPCLESLSIQINKPDLTFAYLFPSSEGWRAAAQNCPKLKVFVIMNNAEREFQRTLVPGIPVVSLSVLDPESLDPIASLLAHVSQHFSGSLELLNLTSFFSRPQETWSW